MIIHAKPYIVHKHQVHVNSLKSIGPCSVGLTRNSAAQTHVALKETEQAHVANIITKPGE